MNKATGKTLRRRESHPTNVDFFREGDVDDDVALGVNHAFRPDLVLKLEHHWNEGYTPEEPPQNFFAPKIETRYWIVSFSASF